MRSSPASSKIDFRGNCITQPRLGGQVCRWVRDVTPKREEAGIEEICSWDEGRGEAREKGKRAVQNIAVCLVQLLPTWHTAAHPLAQPLPPVTHMSDGRYSVGSGGKVGKWRTRNYEPRPRQRWRMCRVRQPESCTVRNASDDGKKSGAARGLPLRVATVATVATDNDGITLDTWNSQLRCRQSMSISIATSSPLRNS